MKIVIDKNETDMFAIQVFFYTGSVFEKDKEHGLSHLLEHMLFKSKRDLSVENLLMDLNSLGGSFNAITSKDYTSFYIYVHHSNWSHSVDLMKKIVCEPHFLENELQKEKQVVLEEFISYEDDTKDKIYDLSYSSILAQKNRYAKSVKGNIDVIKKASTDDLLAYYKSNYNNVMVYINIPSKQYQLDKTKFVDYVHKQLSIFAKKQEKPTQSILMKENHMFSKNLPVVLIKPEPNKQQKCTMISFCGFKANDSSNIVLDFLWDILTGSLNSLLMLEIRQKRGLVYGISSFNNSYFTCGVTGVYFTSSSQDIIEILKYMFSILKHLTKDGLTKDMFSYAKKSYMNKLKYRLNDMRYKMERSMMRHYYDCDWNENIIQNKIKNLQMKDVMNVCKKVFDLQKMSVVSVGNYSINTVKEIESQIHKLILDMK
jgi:predicted Zn-dependent peptidase